MKKAKRLPVEAITRGFVEDASLRERFEREGFGLESVFEHEEWAQNRAAEIQGYYCLKPEDTRLVKHISTPESGEREAWEIYVKIKKGLRFLFLQGEVILYKNTIECCAEPSINMVKGCDQC